LIHFFPTNAWQEVIDRLGLSYSTAKELDDAIDSLPGRPPFLCEEVSIGDEHLKFHYRDILASIRALYGDPDFRDNLIFAPEQHFTNGNPKRRIYSEMYTGDWWWSVQVCKTYLVYGIWYLRFVLGHP
jgi:hypothetical protein